MNKTQKKLIPAKPNLSNQKVVDNSRIIIVLDFYLCYNPDKVLEENVALTWYK